MGKGTKISWCHHTFNPIWGCDKVSPGCKHCYAEAFAKRTGHKVWGKNGARRQFGEKHWAEPLKWNAEALAAGERHRVFCASMADVFEDHPVWDAERPKLWKLIRDTPQLDWLLLTKRPERISTCLPQGMRPWGDGWPNVWLGTTVEDRVHGFPRVHELAKVPAVVRFLSCEPLLEGIGDVPLENIDWLIVGGESGGNARRFNVAWARTLMMRARKAKVTPFVKQLGANIITRNDDGFEAENDVIADTNIPTEEGAWPTPRRIEENLDGHRDDYQGAPVRVYLNDRAGANMAEWPLNLRVQEFPTPRAA